MEPIKTAIPLAYEREGLAKKTKSALREALKTFRAEGFKGVVRRYGWKFFAVFFVYYLVRDVTIYLLIPWLIAKHFIEQ